MDNPNGWLKVLTHLRKFCDSNSFKETKKLKESTITHGQTIHIFQTFVMNSDLI
jgi:hypothetical protein